MSAQRAKSCPRPEALARAVSEGPDRELAAHLAACPDCQREIDAQRELLALARQLPLPPPDPALRARLLETAATVLPVRTQSLAATGLAAAAMLLVALGAGLQLWGTGRPAPQPTRRGIVHPIGAARFVHGGTSENEVVRLWEGAMLVEVAALRPGERFRVVAGDGDIEVRGTMFEVHVQGDRLRSVHVLRGQVEVRPVGRPTALLVENGRWSPPAAPLPEPSPPPTPRKASAALRRPAGTPLAVSEREFQQGFEALRAGQYGPAAESFRRAAAGAAGQPLAEDAGYWRAVALGRAGQRAEAMAALSEFLRRYPTSPRRAEVSSILGWQLFDAGHLDEAEHRFVEALQGGSDGVQESARKGLAAIAALRARKAPPRP